MKFKTINGKKNFFGEDKPLLVKTNGWELITNDEILQIIKSIFDNEDRIYPKAAGFMGSDMFFKEIEKLRKEDDK